MILAINPAFLVLRHFFEMELRHFFSNVVQNFGGLTNVMQSPIQLLNMLDVQEITLNEPSGQNLFGFPYAQNEQLIFAEGSLIRRSFSSYLAHLDLYVYSLSAELNLRYLVKEPSVLLYFMLDGYSEFYKASGQLISEMPCGCFYLCYVNTGRYLNKLPIGSSKVLVLTLRAEWLMRKASELLALQPLLEHFSARDRNTFSLPDCRISKYTLRQLQKVLDQDGKDSDHLEISIAEMLTRLLRHYQEKLSSGDVSSHALRRLKAKEIYSYINKHYADKIPETAVLAAQFNVSERQFVRLVNMAFQMPLHDYLLKIRMNKAIVKLIASTRPIYEIALEVGYSDPHYFSIAFKKYHQISPREAHGLCT